MPMATEVIEIPGLMRTLIYGPEKTKKTWWACRCAELGFNVILLDGDDGAAILRQYPEFLRKQNLDVYAIMARIMVVDLVLTHDKPVFSDFMRLFARPKAQFMWDETAKVGALGVRNPAHAYIKFDITKLTSDDVIILDSWTALAFASLFQFATQQEIDLTDADRVEWEGYGFQGRYLDYLVNFMHALPCHVIIIAHATVYEKRSKDQKTIISQTTQPVSSSGPQARGLAKHFNDVYYFSRLNEVVYNINTGGAHDRVGGSRLFPAGIYEWEKFPPSKIFEMLKATASGEPSKGAIYIPKGAPQDTAAAQAVADILANQSSSAGPKLIVPAEPKKLSIAERIAATKVP